MYQFPEDLKKAYENSQVSFVYYQNIDGQAVPILISDGFCRNTGTDRQTAMKWLKNGLFEHIHPDDVGILSNLSDEFLHQRSPYNIVFRSRLGPQRGKTEEENYVLIHAIGKWQTMPDGTELMVISYANLSQTEKSVQQRTDTYTLLRKDHFYTDPLTGLLNLNYLHEYGKEKVNMIRAEGKKPCIIYTDLHSVRSYNDQYGVKEGDRLLCLTAETLKNQFPSSVVTRGSDDHFIIISWIDDQEELEHRLNEANKIIRSKAGGNTFGIRSGICPIEENDTPSGALDRAKQAMKSINNDMNREVAFFSQEENLLYLEERYILENIDKAIQNGWIKVYYHALYRIKTKKIAAFEGLARWVDPVRGVITPGQFIPPLQKYHQLYKLDLAMFEQVCREVRIRKENGLPLVPVSVNFSRQDFDYADIAAKMNELYEKYDLADIVDKSYFIIEITEQDLAVGAEKLREQLKQIRDNGYRLWLDDFGSGYSAINVFSKFDFDLIKYDMELIRNLDVKGGVNRIILEELVYLAKRFGLHTLTEGIETAEQLDFVEKIGCELAQGFYLYKPQSLDEILARVKSGDPVKSYETAEERLEFNKIRFEE